MQLLSRYSNICAICGLAEKYETAEELDGTVVCFGGEKEVEACK